MPTSAEAVRACDRLQRKLKDFGDGRKTSQLPLDLSERIYRDPVHNIIRLRTDTREGELMMRSINAPEFQRLRRISSEIRFKLI